METIIHVNRNVLASNKKHNKRDPAIIIREGSKRTYCKKAKIGDNTYMVQQEDCPLDCGARIWITSTEKVEVVE